MNLHIAGVMSAALVAGLAGSVAAYRAQVAEDVAVDKPAAVSSSRPPAEPDTRFRWAPCPKGSQLEAGVCVTDVVRTVVVPAAPVQLAAPGAAPVVAAPSDHDEDEGYDDEDDEYDHHDDGDEDHDEDDDEEDDDDEDDDDEDDDE